MIFLFKNSKTMWWRLFIKCLLCTYTYVALTVFNHSHYGYCKPGIFGLAWSLARCVSWRHRQWQCCILHNSDSMDALLADRPSTFADITVIALEELGLCTADMV